MNELSPVEQDPILPVAESLILARTALHSMRALEQEALAHFLGQTFCAAERLRDNQSEWLAFLAHPDCENSKVPRHKDGDGDYLRLAMRFALGLNDPNGRSKSNKYYVALRPFFIRRATSEDAIGCFRALGIQKMAYEGAHKDFASSAVVTPPNARVLERLELLEPGVLVCVVQFERSADGKPILSFEIPHLIAHTGHRRIRVLPRNASLKRR